MKTITRPLRTIQGRLPSTPDVSPVELVTFLAAEPRHLESLLTETGLQTSDLRALPHDPALLDGVIAWALASDDRILVLSTFLSLTPEQTALGLARLRSRPFEE